MYIKYLSKRHETKMTATTKPRIKVAFFLHRLQHYRIPILRKLSLNIEVVVFCENFADFKACDLGFEIRPIKVLSFGPFKTSSPTAYFGLDKEFDVVVGLWNLRCIDVVLYSILGSLPLVVWGIGVTGSYTKKFGEINFSTYLKYLLLKRCKSAICYSEFAQQVFLGMGAKRENIFVANNTIVNEDTGDFHRAQKETVLFIGTLYPEKGAEQVIECYANACASDAPPSYSLTIVGDGELLEELELLANSLGVGGYVKFLGRIDETSKLSEIFRTALYCVSPRQAGLSVLLSMSFGVPFVTTKTAITGGERLNIIHETNGLLLDDTKCLTEILKGEVYAIDDFRRMGKNAYDHYHSNCSADQMVDGILKAVTWGENNDHHCKK